MKINPTRIALIFLLALVVASGLSIYLKLCVFGWEEESSLAVGLIRMRVPSESDARIMNSFTDKLSTISSKEIKLESGMITDPPWPDGSDGHSVRLILAGRGVIARGYMRLSPLRIEYEGRNEDADVIQQIVYLAKSRGVVGPIEIQEIYTPIHIITNF